MLPDDAVQCPRCGLSSAPPEMPRNHLTLAVLACFLCCLPAGLVGVVYASQVNARYAAGDYEGAATASKAARSWSLAGIALGSVYAALYVGAIVIGAMHGR
jgi:hypothetical protein